MQDGIIIIHNDHAEVFDRPNHSYDIELKNCIHHLWRKVEVAECARVGAIIKVVMDNVELFSTILMEPNLVDAISEGVMCLDCDDLTGFDSVMLYWDCELRKNDENEDEFIEMMSMVGLIDEDSENEPEIHDLIFAPMDIIINASLGISKDYNVLDGRSDDSEENLIIGCKSPTLLNILKAFFFNFSYLGNKEQKKDARDNVLNMHTTLEHLKELDDDDDEGEEWKKGIDKTKK